MRPRCWLLLALTLGASGCVVGPDYHGPPPVAGAGGAFTRASSEASATEPAARWWTALNDAELDRLIDLTLGDSPDIHAAQARVREARATLSAQRANGRPSSSASAAYLRAHNLTALLGDTSPGAPTGGSDSNLYFLGFDASWELDLFGANARAVENARAAEQASRASLADLLVSLTAEVAQAYIELRDAQQRLALTERNIEIETRVVELMQIRRAGGTASDLDVTRVSNQLDTTRATLGPLRALITEQLDRLAILAARAPGMLDSELATSTQPPAPPAKVAIGDPAALLRRRPDIVVAERQLAAQTASIGQSVAAQFPRIELLGDLGFASLAPGALVNSGNFTYIAAPLLQWSPWDFGRHRAQIARSNAARDEAEANYRHTVLAALEDAETSLARYGQQRDTVLDLERARDSAEKVYTLTEIRLRGGTAATTDVLDADTRRVQAELSYEEALAQLTQDYVALQKSLGLGWVSPP
jgi:outer membrane protein, multidrug efflux system